MRKISPYNPAPSVATLAPHYDAGKQADLTRLMPIIQAAEAVYVASAPNVHQIIASPLSDDDKKILVEAYEKKPSAVAAIFTAMLGALPAIDRSLCPFCNLSEEYELDHYLPKRKFPEFAIYPRNLVPICGRCNKKKGQVVADRLGRRLIIHPFHELADAPKFIRCRLDIRATTITAEIELFNPAVGLGPGVFDLLMRHFKRLGLGNRLSNRANTALQTAIIKLKPKSHSVIRRTLMSNNVHISSPTNYWHSALHDELRVRVNDVINWFAANP